MKRDTHKSYSFPLFAIPSPHPMFVSWTRWTDKVNDIKNKGLGSLSIQAFIPPAVLCPSFPSFLSLSLLVSFLYPLVPQHTLISFPHFSLLVSRVVFMDRTRSRDKGEGMNDIFSIRSFSLPCYTFPLYYLSFSPSYLRNNKLI